jgi:carbamoyl-phosphate synthase small subunit
MTMDRPLAKILVVQPELDDPPHLFGAWLEEAGCVLEVCHPYAGDAVPTVDGYAGLLVMGGAMSANDDGVLEWVAPVKELLRDAVSEGVPTLGICLGHQLLARATGHATYKLPFGHRGANHPVLERATGQVLVTSQNHGFAVEASEAREATHVSLYDGTVEGLDFPELRARSAQFHPEAGPGPHDAWPILSDFIDEVKGKAA